MSERFRNFVEVAERLLKKRRKIGPALAASALALSGCAVSANTPSSSPSSSQPTFTTVGECEPFTVFAQNVWPATPNGNDYGAAVRAEPDIDAERLRGVAGNDPLRVDGWEEAAEPAYPRNPAGRNGLYWYHVVSGGWVNDAAVRGEKTDPDPSKGYDKSYRDASETAPRDPDCEITQ